MLLFLLISVASALPTITFLPNDPTATPNPLFANPKLAFLSNVTYYDQFKNSPFSPICPTQSSAPLSNSGQAVMHSRAKTQEEFCMHLRPDITWIIIPTRPSPAAYLPDWPSLLRQILVADIFNLVMLSRSLAIEHPNACTSFRLVAILTIVGQLFWPHQVAAGFEDPQYAPWLDPFSCLTLFSFFAMDRFDDSAKAAWAITASLNLIFFLVYTSLRFSPEHLLGMMSYKPLLVEPLTSSLDSQGCYALLHYTRYTLYSDTNAPQMRILHIILISLSIVAIFFVCRFKRPLFGFSLVLLFHIAVIIWVGVLASQGTPFMFDEHCGVVTVALSPKFGYWDTRVQEYGYKLHIIRIVAGL